MNKTELVNAVAEKLDTSRASASAALDAVLSEITNALSRGDDVSILGFGTFSVTARPERPGRNPATGKEMTIAASKTPKFKPGKSLKDAVQ